MKAVHTVLFAASVAISSVFAEPAKLATRNYDKTPPVTVKGNAFWVGDKRFYVRGLAYQPGGSSGNIDPISDVNICRRDVAKFKELGVNTVRIYMVDNSVDHDECMALLADAGIYLALDVNTPKYSIRRDLPGPSYNDVYLQSVFATVEEFAKYDNTLLFFSGNEVIDDNTTTPAAPYVKAVTRDIRQFIGSRGLRKIPVGYSAADVDSNRYEMAQYMNCGPDDERSDFFAFNDYSWCSPSSYQLSGWDQKVKLYGNYSLPLFLSEYGCITNDRDFGEVSALYSSQMTPVYSGGLAYEYTEEDNNYGLVEVDGDSVTELDDFGSLKAAFAKTPAPSGDGGYKRDGKPSNCPPRSPNWEVDSTKLPAIPEPAKRFMEEGAGKGPGLKGPGSQNSGTPSSGTAEPGSGTVTTTASAKPTKSKDAAASLRCGTFSLAPFVGTAIVLASALLGATLL